MLSKPRQGELSEVKPRQCNLSGVKQKCRHKLKQSNRGPLRNSGNKAESCDHLSSMPSKLARKPIVIAYKRYGSPIHSARLAPVVKKKLVRNGECLGLILNQDKLALSVGALNLVWRIVPKQVTTALEELG